MKIENLYFSKHKVFNTGKTRFKKGMTPWNKGIKKPMPICSKCGIKLKKKNSKFCKKCVPRTWGNKISKSLIGRNRGKKSSNWKGGISSLNKLIRACYKYRQWHYDVLTRDNYICQKCLRRGGKLHIDHYPKMFRSIIHEYNIKTLKQALDCEELWNINNGRTLCKECHFKETWEL